MTPLPSSIPVFSSGVFLALRSGEMAGDAADAALTSGDFLRGAIQRLTERELCKGIEAMRRLVYAFYDHAFSFRVFLKHHPDLHGDMTDCLIGNLFRDFDPLFTAVAEFAKIPATFVPWQAPPGGQNGSRAVIFGFMALFPDRGGD